MSHGVIVSGTYAKTKKAVKEALVADPSKVCLESTSMFESGVSGSLSRYIDGPVRKVNVVGPNPYTDRRWYGTITVGGGKATIS